MELCKSALDMNKLLYEVISLIKFGIYKFSFKNVEVGADDYDEGFLYVIAMAKPNAFPSCIR